MPKQVRGKAVEVDRDTHLLLTEQSKENGVPIKTLVRLLALALKNGKADIGLT